MLAGAVDTTSAAQEAAAGSKDVMRELETPKPREGDAAYITSRWAKRKYGIVSKVKDELTSFNFCHERYEKVHSGRSGIPTIMPPCSLYLI